MGLPVVTVASGGLPVVESTVGGLPVTEASNGYGVPVTKVAARGLPVVFETIGVGSGVTYATWDTATATAVTLSGGNLVVTNTGGTAAEQGARVAATAAKNTGKYYYETTITVGGVGARRSSGVGTSASTYTAMSASASAGTVGCIYFHGSGNIWANGVNTSVTLGSNMTPCGFAVDLDNRRMWFRVLPGGNWNNNVANNPATNVGGVALPAGAMVPFCMFGGTAGDNGQVYVANFGASAFVGAVPAGFTSGWPATVADTTAPTITSGATASNVENTVLAHALTADEAVTWAIVGGADQARFELSGSTLRWLGDGTKDFEAPNDADANNAYIVQVRATDTASNQTNQTITVTVTDVAEGGGTAILDRAGGMILDRAGQTINARV